MATSDEGGRMAFPLTTVAAGPNALSEVEEIVKKEKVEKIVIGESRNFKGEENPLQEDIEQFKKDLEGLSGLTVVYQSEFLSSAAAARQYEPVQKSRKEAPSQEKLDAAAAALILQSFLDTLKR